MKNTHAGWLFLVKLKPATLLKVSLFHGCFSHFLNCTNGTKLRNASHVRRMVKKCGKCRIFTLFQVWKSGGNTLFPQTGKSPKTLRKLHYQKFSAKENQLKISWNFAPSTNQIIQDKGLRSTFCLFVVVTIRNKAGRCISS